jgi:hypothetical protein
MAGTVLFTGDYGLTHVAFLESSMTLHRLAAILMMLFAGSAVAASEPSCAPTKLDALVARGQDLYFGELHGTAEVPALVKCLVLVALRNKREPLIVSLEQESQRRDPASDLWRGTDGRSSRAMWELTQFLLEQEKLGRLELHQQLDKPVPFKEGVAPPTVDPVQYEKNMGGPLRGLAARGQLIALSGNMHSRKEALPGFPYEPAGSYAGPDVLHIDLEPGAGGSAWTCLSNGCGSHDLPGGTSASTVGELVDGNWMGHDFIYRMPRLTASPPKLPPAQ